MLHFILERALFECKITRNNYRQKLAPYLHEQTALLNFAVSVCSVDLILLAQQKNAFYIDSCIDPWEYGSTDQGLLESNFGLREGIKQIQPGCQGKSTAIVAHGANPGFVSILVKKALHDMARANGMPQEPDSKEGWAALARDLDVRVIHISERDTQVESGQKGEDEFVCTWSVDGFITECLQAAELGWGSHERQIPDGATLYHSRTQAALTLAEAGKDTRVKSWSPNALDFTGYLITHNESLSIAEYLTLGRADAPAYRPTVYYAYHPCDATVESLSLLEGNTDEKVRRKRILMDEVISGMDELGIFLISGTYPSFWLGSNLSIEKARKQLPHNNATSLQVVASVIAALKWIEANPGAGVIESEELPWRFIYEKSEPYWAPMTTASIKWQPVPGGRLAFQEFLSPPPERDERPVQPRIAACA
jgi:homospermidine synthase